MLKRMTSMALAICAITMAQSYGGQDSVKVSARAADSNKAENVPDNSKVNKRDASDSTITPLNQGNSKADIALTRKIRRAVYRDKTLSTSAHNIKIIAWEGRVTLRGPVKTESEKSQIVAKASEIAGSSAVVDQLEVAAKKFYHPLTNESPKTKIRNRVFMSKSIIGLSNSEEQAIKIVDRLKDGGFSGNSISVLFPDKSGTRDFAHEKKTKAPEGTATGVTTGGVLGGGLGWLVGIGALAIPGVGPFIAAGPIMAALGGAALGATVGGISGALIGLGIPEYEAKQYESKIREGRILISVHTDDAKEKEVAHEILKTGGAEDISSVEEESVPKHSN